jgi:putative transposase
MFEKSKFNRHSIRLRDYDYSQAGGYFITICVGQHQCVLGEIIDSSLLLSQLGQIIERSWLALPEHFEGITTDQFIVMPNHFHGIIFICEAGSNKRAREPRPYRIKIYHPSEY